MMDRVVSRPKAGGLRKLRADLQGDSRDGTEDSRHELRCVSRQSGGERPACFQCSLEAMLVCQTLKGTLYRQNTQRRGAPGVPAVTRPLGSFK